MSTWSDLPPELTVNVAGHMDAKSLCAFREVDRKCLAASARPFGELFTELRISLSDKGLRALSDIAKFPPIAQFVKEIMLSDTVLTHEPFGSFWDHHVMPRHAQIWTGQLRQRALEGALLLQSDGLELRSILAEALDNLGQYNTPITVGTYSGLHEGLGGIKQVPRTALTASTALDNLYRPFFRSVRRTKIVVDAFLSQARISQRFVQGFVIQLTTEFGSFYDEHHEPNVPHFGTRLIDSGLNCKIIHTSHEPVHGVWSTTFKPRDKSLQVQGPPVHRAHLTGEDLCLYELPAAAYHTLILKDIVLNSWTYDSSPFEFLDTLRHSSPLLKTLKLHGVDIMDQSLLDTLRYLYTEFKYLQHLEICGLQSYKDVLTTYEWDTPLVDWDAKLLQGSYVWAGRQEVLSGLESVMKTLSDAQQSTE